MTVFAIVVLAVWALGIVAITALTPGLIRRDPMARLVFDLAPVPACLATALAVVFWPAAFGAKGLARLVERGRR